VITLSNYYHPGNQFRVGPTAAVFSYNILTDMGFDVLREFWPDVTKKLRLPLRPEPAGAGAQSNPQ
jgi:hypothetical protein